MWRFSFVLTSDLEVWGEYFKNFFNAVLSGTMYAYQTSFSDYGITEVGKANGYSNAADRVTYSYRGLFAKQLTQIKWAKTHAI